MDGIIWQMPKSLDRVKTQNLVQELRHRTDELCAVQSWNQRNGRWQYNQVF